MGNPTVPHLCSASVRKLYTNSLSKLAKTLGSGGLDSFMFKYLWLQLWQFGALQTSAVAVQDGSAISSSSVLWVFNYIKLPYTKASAHRCHVWYKLGISCSNPPVEFIPHLGCRQQGVYGTSTLKQMFEVWTHMTFYVSFPVYIVPSAMCMMNGLKSQKLDGS